MFRSLDHPRGAVASRPTSLQRIQHIHVHTIFCCITKTYNKVFIWCDFDRASSLICGNKMPTRCIRGFYCRSYCLHNMFRAPLCPSSGAQEYYAVVAACGISCCGFSSSWSGVELRVMCLVCRMLVNQHPANWTHNLVEQAIRSAIKTSIASSWHFISTYSLTQKNGNFWKTQQKLKKSNKKNFIDRNWTITTCLLRDSNPNYQCLKITSCRWCTPLRMHSFNLLLRFPIARCNISAGIPRISSWILCFNSTIVLGRVV